MILAHRNTTEVEEPVVDDESVEGRGKGNKKKGYYQDDYGYGGYYRGKLRLADLNLLYYFNKFIS